MDEQLNFSWHWLFLRHKQKITEKSSKIEWEQNFLKWIECKKWIFFIIEWIRWKIYNFYHHQMEKCEDWNSSSNKKIESNFLESSSKTAYFFKIFINTFKRENLHWSHLTGKTPVEHQLQGHLLAAILMLYTKFSVDVSDFFEYFLCCVKKLFLWLNCWK